jgi:predicted Zn-dependent protease
LLEDKLPARVGALRAELALGDARAARTWLDTLRKSAAKPELLAVLEGDVLVAEKATDEALAQYRVAARAGIAEAVLKQQQLELDRGDPGAAKQTLEAWLDDHPNDVEAQLAFANALLVNGENAAAIEHYRRMESQQPGNVVVLNNLAWLYYEARDPRAEEIARRAKAAAPDSSAVNDTLGWILVNADKVSDAIPLLESAALAEEASGSIQYHLAVSYEKAGRLQDALRTVDRALRQGTFPEQGEAHAMRERLTENTEPSATKT